MKKILSILLFVLLLPCILFVNGCKQETDFLAKIYEKSVDGKYIYMGEYPQSQKVDSVTVSEIPDDNGYYLGSDNERYVKEGNTYFKVEKIKWRILQEKDGKAFLMSEIVLDLSYFSMDFETYEEYLEYYGDANLSSYKHSSLRNFLINDFYNVAFSDKEKEIINLTEVDNSFATLKLDHYLWAGENTLDYVFALSYADVTNPEYGFINDLNETDLARCIDASDYAYEKGAWAALEEPLAVAFWTRSPCGAGHAHAVHGYLSDMGDASVGEHNLGVIPAMYITL